MKDDVTTAKSLIRCDLHQLNKNVHMFVLHLEEIADNISAPKNMLFIIKKLFHYLVQHLLYTNG